MFEKYEFQSVCIVKESRMGHLHVGAFCQSMGMLIKRIHAIQKPRNLPPRRRRTARCGNCGGVSLALP